MRTLSTRTFRSAMLLVSLSDRPAFAQLLGCDAVGCPMERPSTAQCEIGNSTLQGIGIANLTTILDDQPLTWTFGSHEIDGTGGAPSSWDRNFYLGTPPSLQLNDTNGCALFFDGIPQKLDQHRASELTKFTCSDVIEEACILGLKAQAQTAFEDIVNGIRNDSQICGRLRDTLVEEHPSACNEIMGSWGKIVAKPLTGSSAQGFAEEKNCHPTTGQEYDLSLVFSNRSGPTPRHANDLLPTLMALTPIMTVFSKGNETDVGLSCLKLVESSAGSTAPTDEKEGSAVLLNPVSTWHLILGAIFFLFMH